MLLETLGKLRGRHSGNQRADRSGESMSLASDGGNTEESGSTSSATVKLNGGRGSVSSGASGSTDGKSKRYSNNLFGSGRLRDYTYNRNASSSRSAGATASSKASSTMSSEDFAGTPQLVNASTSPESLSSPAGSTTDEPGFLSTSDQGFGREASLSANEPISAAAYRLQKSLGPAGLKRASIALQNVIKEIEFEELEEEIVMPRSTPILRNYPDQQSHSGQHQPKYLGEDFVRDSSASLLSSVIQAGMAISSDKSQGDPNGSSAQRGPSPVPLGHVPGYIPGMPRPMTPRDLDFAEEQRSHSTTPRATSPTHGSFTLSEAGSAAASISNILRRESITSRLSPRPTTPFLQRSIHGGHNSSPSDGHASIQYASTEEELSGIRVNTDLTGATDEFSSSRSPSVLSGRRRPASPLVNPPISAMSSSPPGVSSRPTTPSKVTWGYRTSTKSLSPRSGEQSQHSRDNSWASEGDSDAPPVGDMDEEPHQDLSTRPFSNGIDSQKPFPRSDSPGPEKGQLSRSWTFKASQVASGAAPASSTNGDGPHHHMSPRANHRSLTPTQTPRSPSSPGFGSAEPGYSRSVRRASKQNGFGSPFNLGPLLHSRANMSTSSLESTGSSFHSWDGEKDKVVNIFKDVDTPPSWHNIPQASSSVKSFATFGDGGTLSTSRTSPEDDWDPDDVVKTYAGLKRTDFAAIQEKLVTVAKLTEHRGSAMRKRRPSTSQSNHSVRDLRVASPPPPPASPTVNATITAREQQQIHILNTCIEQPLAAPMMSHSNSSSSFDRPNRNLARVLFGQDDDVADLNHDLNAASPVAIVDTSRPSPSQTTLPEPSDLILPPPTETTLENTNRLDGASPVPSFEATPALALNRSVSGARHPPRTPQERAALELEVQQKVEAATLALRKRPSQEGLAHSPSLSRGKRIDPSQISKPLLVSSSTSVDTIALKAPANSAGNGAGPSKIGSRFKKLRGSLRVKNASTVEESPVSGLSAKSPVSQSAQCDPDKLKSPGPPTISSAATDSGRFKVNAPSPPVSAGPGLKGFMARFRKHRNTDMAHSAPSPMSSDPHPASPHFPASPLSPSTPSQRQFTSSSGLSRTSSQGAPSASDSESISPTTGPQHHRNQFASSVSSTAPSLPATSETNESEDDSAIHQLFAAATNLGIDQGALNDLLKRSGSHSARTILDPASTTTRSNKDTEQHLTVPQIQHPTLSSSSGSDYTATPGMFNSSPVSEVLVGNGIDSAPAKDSGTSTTRRPEQLRQAKNVDTAINPVVRRTLIWAEPRQSIADPLKRNRSRRRASVQSTSSRSIHDRVPTPPPSKIPQSKRFSHDVSPPVPQLPHALGGPSDNLLHVRAGQLEKSNSAAYDSLYELYGDSRVASMMVDPNHPDFRRGDTHYNPDTGTGVELMELANGEIVWNVVHGLRDDDEESLYTSRNSIGSEYSTQDGVGSIQGPARTHTRASSKGSYTSFSKKTSGGKSRPETKILLGSPEKIGRLIEKFSQGMDAGSFNFAPMSTSNRSHNGPGHSNNSSLSTNDWTIEEIDNMLTSINRP